MPDLRQLRLAAGLSQAELAARARIRIATLSALERGQSSPRRTTVLALAQALNTSPDAIVAALSDGQPQPVGAAWPFLAGLDRDLRAGLIDQLMALWTHHSTGLEGNTVSLGDTLVILREGITVAGHSLREHQELHGHRDAIALLDALLRRNRGPTVTDLHGLHRCIQTGVSIDIFAPVGRWKVEGNGTQAITSDGRSQWHDYAAPAHTEALMHDVLKMVDVSCKHPPTTIEALVEAYLTIHLGITNVHPYADGNGRLARLVANLPILRAGQPPLLIDKRARREYLCLLGDYCLLRGQPKPGEALLGSDEAVASLRPLTEFLREQWKPTLDAVASAHARQAERNR